MKLLYLALSVCCRSWRIWSARFALPLAFAAMLAGPTGQAIAKDGLALDLDTIGAILNRPGFDAAGKRAGSDGPLPGAAGSADYSLLAGPVSIVSPPKDVSGLLTLFRVTRVLCASLHRGSSSLSEVAPKGFFIARGDVHELGFGSAHWKENWYAISVTGDSLEDAAAGHPAWQIRYDDTGNLTSCAVTFGSATVPDKSVSDAEKANAARYMYAGLPQAFSAFITAPRFAGLGRAAPSDLILMAVPCGGNWCRISTIYDFRKGRWYLSSRIEFNLPPKWN